MFFVYISICFDILKYISQCLRPTTATALGTTPTPTPTPHDTTPHIEINKKYSKNRAREHPKTAKNRRKSRPVAPLGDPGALLGAPGAPSGVQRRKSDEKRGSFPLLPGPVLEHFSVNFFFFHEKNCPGACFLRIVFLLNFIRFVVVF